MQELMPPDNPSERATDLRLLYALSSSFNAVLDLPELLHQVVQAALELTHAVSGQAALIDQETAQLSVYSIDKKGRSLSATLGGDAYAPLLTYVIAHSEQIAISQGDNLQSFG